MPMKKFTDIARLDADQARDYLESLRWPLGPACPHCGSMAAYKLNSKTKSKRPMRKGVYKCKDCRKQFSVTVGTLFEGSHIPLNKWLMAVSFICSSKKGISAHQLHRMLGVTYKSAWFMAHRIRYAMARTGPQKKLQGVVEVDETYIGGRARGKRGRGARNKTPVVALVSRNGEVRSKTIKKVTGKNIKSFIVKNVDKKAVLMTDDFKSYKPIRKDFQRKVIRHSYGEYVRGQVHTNTIEGYFSLLKRGITGVFHHVSDKHLHRYLQEFNFRYNMRKQNDGVVAFMLLNGVEGKRLLYRDSYKKRAV